LDNMPSIWAVSAGSDLPIGSSDGRRPFRCELGENSDEMAIGAFAADADVTDLEALCVVAVGLYLDRTCRIEPGDGSPVEAAHRIRLHDGRGDAVAQETHARTLNGPARFVHVAAQGGRAGNRSNFAADHHDRIATETGRTENQRKDRAEHHLPADG